MPSITIVSGCPGSGKSTVSKMLAANRKMGVRIETDVFYHFLAHRLDPSTPESKLQNTAVVHSFLKSALSFYDDGYDVFLDGVIGPWWMEAIQETLPNFQYAILHADLKTVLGRTTQRSKTAQSSASPDLVRFMHSQFENLEGVSLRTIDTRNKPSEVVLEEFLAKQEKGDFA